MTGGLSPLGATDTDRLLDGLDAFRRAIEANLGAAIEGTDAEAVHDLRVAVRRTRSGLKHCADVLPAKEQARYQDEFTRLQAVTGPARDYQVWMSSLPADDPLRFVLAGHYDSARLELVRALSSRRTGLVLARWHMVLAKQTRGRNVISGAAVIEEQRHRVLKAASKAGPEGASADLHRVRKRVKELRYVTELFDTGDVKAARRPLKRLQDTLGEVQDVAFQREWLHAHAGELGPIDVRLKELDERDAVARLAYVERFAEFTDPPST